MLPTIPALPANYKCEEDEEISKDIEFVAYWWSKESALPVGAILDSKHSPVRWVLKGRPRWRERALLWSYIGNNYREFAHAMREFHERSAELKSQDRPDSRVAGGA